MKTQAYRYLRGYTLDPSFSTLLDTYMVNQALYRIRWEPTLSGPIGEYFEVIDYDPASRCFYEPVNLHDESILASNGLNPSEGNPRFHQQFVYAIAMRTLEYFEEALGRKVIWHRRRYKENDEDKYEYVEKLRIYPHALREANAYYFPEKRALLFGYFKSSAHTGGMNMPGGSIFTCLSPDIVAHEVTHAILESIHPRFNENTNLDVPAFHEAFADIIALLQRFMAPELLEHQMAASKGRLGGATILGELATQFGNAFGHRSLRSAIGRVNPQTLEWERLVPDPEEYRREMEPHHRGAILVAAFFDAFVRVYNYKTQDLFQIGAAAPDSPLLIKRLAKEAGEIARHLLHIAIQALDYCPPLDISFGDYFRALVTADVDMAPNDEFGYRIALIEAFRARGIFPDRVNVMSVESLVWNAPTGFTDEEEAFMKEIRSTLGAHIQRFFNAKDRKELYDESQRVSRKVHAILMSIKEKADDSSGRWSAFLGKLGLAARPPVFEIKGKPYKCDKEIKIEVHQVRPAFRYTREGRRIEQMILTLTQKIEAQGDDGRKIIFRGGCTIIFNMNSDYAVEFIITKNINSQRRFARQAAYQSGEVTGALPLSDTMHDRESDAFRLSFRSLHKH